MRRRLQPGDTSCRRLLAARPERRIFETAAMPYHHLISMFFSHGRLVFRRISAGVFYIIYLKLAASSTGSWYHQLIQHELAGVAVSIALS